MTSSRVLFHLSDVPWAALNENKRSFSIFNSALWGDHNGKPARNENPFQYNITH